VYTTTFTILKVLNLIPILNQLIIFLDLSEMGRMEKQFLKHLEQIEAEKQVKQFNCTVKC